MPLSPKSEAAIKAAHPLLQKLFRACAADPACPKFQVLESRRGRKDQEAAFARGNSKAHFGQSPHNYDPAIALDVVPLPLNWDDIKAFKQLGAFVVAKAKELGIPISWGGGWRSFKDYPHYELDPWRDYAKTLYGYDK